MEKDFLVGLTPICHGMEFLDFFDFFGIIFHLFFSGSKTPDKNYVSKREFSFTLEDDIYLRYLSFSTAEELQTEMVRRVPHKIDIGAVFNAKPSDHKKIANFQVLEYQIVTLRMPLYIF